jgi:hypothetical protein
MTPEQTGQILAAAAARDARTVGLADVLAWHEDIGDLDYPDALAAVSRHYRDSTDRIMPAHVRRIAAEIQRERIRATRQALAKNGLTAIAVATEDRSAEVHALIAQLRDSLPPIDPAKYRRTEVLEWERQRDRERWAQPNPHYKPDALAEGAPA